MARKHLPIVSDTFQSRFLFVSLIHYAIIIAAFLGALFLPLMLQLDSLDLPDSARGELANQFLSLHERVWPAMLVALLLLGFHLVFFSHRIAGPLYRWRRLFSEVGAGNLMVQGTMRKSDYLEKELQGLNHMIVSLRTRIEGLQVQHGQISRSVEALERALAHDERPEARRCADDLLARVDELGAELWTFKTTVEPVMEQPDRPQGVS